MQDYSIIQCDSNGVTAVLHYAIDIWLLCVSIRADYIISYLGLRGYLNCVCIVVIQFHISLENPSIWCHILIHWGRVTHICVSKLTIIGSDNGLSPHRRQAIIWTNDGILLIGPLGTNFSEISIEILTVSFKKMRLKVSSAKRRPFCLGLNVLIGNGDLMTAMYFSISMSDYFFSKKKVLFNRQPCWAFTTNAANDWLLVKKIPWITSLHWLRLWRQRITFRLASYHHVMLSITWIANTHVALKSIAITVRYMYSCVTCIDVWYTSMTWKWIYELKWLSYLPMLNEVQGGHCN